MAHPALLPRTGRADRISLRVVGSGAAVPPHCGNPAAIRSSARLEISASVLSPKACRGVTASPPSPATFSLGDPHRLLKGLKHIDTPHVPDFVREEEEAKGQAFLDATDADGPTSAQ